MRAESVRLLFAARSLNDLYGAQPAAAFGPSALKALRQRLVDDGLGMSTVNSYVGIVKQVFVWGCEEEIVPVDIAGALKMVKQLQKGRTAAKVYDPVQPVKDATVEATLRHLKPHYQDMVKVQRLISGRPQDVFNMRYCDIDQSGDVWKYMPFDHKTKKRGKVRVLHIGPRAQKILADHLERCKNDPTGYLFTNCKGGQYTAGAYGSVIKSACEKAGVEHWSPNQLRHAGATEIREKYGLEHAKSVLGHTDAKTTEIYAKVHDEKAILVAREIG